VQRSLVENQLASLLDHVPKGRAVKVLRTSRRLKSKYSRLPTLDLKAKKAELDGLLDELRRDAKRSIFKDSSNREEIIVEAVDSLIDWLSDIWSVAYEYHVNFSLVHSTLLFTSETLERISNARGG